MTAVMLVVMMAMVMMVVVLIVMKGDSKEKSDGGNLHSYRNMA